MRLDLTILDRAILEAIHALDADELAASVDRIAASAGPDERDRQAFRDRVAHLRYAETIQPAGEEKPGGTVARPG